MTTLVLVVTLAEGPLNTTMDAAPTMTTIPMLKTPISGEIPLRGRLPTRFRVSRGFSKFLDARWLKLRSHCMESVTVFVIIRMA